MHHLIDIDRYPLHRLAERDGQALVQHCIDDIERNGMFTLAGLASDRVVVIAFGPGYSKAQQADVAVGTADLLLRVNRLGSIRGILRDLAGEPIAGSRVFAEPVERLRPAGSFSVEGFERFREGQVETAVDGSFRTGPVC